MKDNIEMYDRVKDMDRVELQKFLEDDPIHYSSYSSLWKYLFREESLRNVFESAYDFYDIDFNGKTVLDIGPGSGLSLDVAKERGAKECHFIDRDAIITRWVEIKGYTKQFFDYQGADEIDRAIAMEEKYDVVIARGSFNADRWNRLEFGDPDKVAEWVTKIGKTVIFTPTWDRGHEMGGNYHNCHGDHLKEYLVSRFHKGFIKRGYTAQCVEGFNEPKLMFPITYYK